MCDTPITIKNLNNFEEKRIKARLAKIFPWKDFNSSHILVPCGKCYSCVRSRQQSIVQRMQFESQKNHFFMGTITYQNSMMPLQELKDGSSFPYADVRDLQCALKMMRKENAFGIPFRTLWVSELGSRRGRPHFHILFLFPKEYFPKGKDDYIMACDAFASKAQHYFTLFRYWRRNVGSRRNPIWEPLSRYVEKWTPRGLRKTYDFHYINPFLTKNGVEDCGAYVLKYMFKKSTRADWLQKYLRDNYEPDEFSELWNKLRPRYRASIGFGYNAEVDLRRHVFNRDPEIVEQLKQSVDSSLGDPIMSYPVVFHPLKGQPMMLSPYYMRNLEVYDMDKRRAFWEKRLKQNPHLKEGDIAFTDKKSLYTVENRFTHLDRISLHADSVGVDMDFDIFEED